MNFSALLPKMVIFIVLLAIGYAGAKKGTLNADFSKAASSLLLNVFIVASIVNSVIGQRPELSQREFWKAFLFLWIMTLIVYAAAAVCAVPVRKENNAPQTEMLMAVVNNLFIGLPIAQAIFGNEAVFYMGISCVPYNLLLYTYGVWRLKKNGDDRKIAFKDMLSAPLIAAIVSLIVFLINPTVPDLVKDLFGTVSSATVSLSMIIIGATLGKTSPAVAFGKVQAYAVSFIRLIAVPLIVYFVLRPFTDNNVLLYSCVIIAGCPAGAITTPLSIKFGYDPQYSSEIVMVSTVLSMISLPVLLKILM